MYIDQILFVLKAITELLSGKKSFLIVSCLKVSDV